MFKSVFPSSGDQVTIDFEGTLLKVPAGSSVTAAVLGAASVPNAGTRTTAKRHEERGPFCLMGVCYECLMEIDGVPNQQACLIPVREGMRVKRQEGAPVFEAPARNTGEGQ